MGFIVKSDLPPRIHAGMMIEYRVSPLLGIPMTWLTEITQVRDGLYFVDEQRVGPYAIWHHEHHFRDLGDGRIEMQDKVTYTLPLSPFSEVVHPFLVKPQLDKIFAFREKRVNELFFGASGDAEHFLQHLHAALVLRHGADADADPLGQLVGGHGAHDHAFVHHGFEDRVAIAHLNEHEVRVAGNELPGLAAANWSLEVCCVLRR